MSGAGLVDLARRFVAASEEVDDLRETDRPGGPERLGGAPAPEPALESEEPKPRPTRAQRSGGNGSQPKSRSPKTHPKVLAAAAEDAKVLALLKSTPGLRSNVIAAKTGSKPSTMVERLKRMTARGQVERDGDGAYSVP